MELLANVVAGQADSPDLLARAGPGAASTHLVATLRRDQQRPDARLEGPARQLPRPGHRQAARPAGLRRREGRRSSTPSARRRARRSGRPCRPRGGSSRGTTDREAEIQRGEQVRLGALRRPARPLRATSRRSGRSWRSSTSGSSWSSSATTPTSPTSAAKTIGALLPPEVAGPARGRRDPPRARSVPRRPEGRLRPPLRRRRPASSTSAGTPPGTASSAGRTCQGNWTTGPHGLLRQRVPRPGDVRRRPVRAPRRRDRQPRLQDEALPAAGRRGRSTPWPRGRARRSRRWGWACRSTELESPSWRTLLGNVGRRRDRLRRAQGPAGLPLRVVHRRRRPVHGRASASPRSPSRPGPRITDAASLYCLGVAYTIAPDKVERFLAANWPVVSTLLTDHGPWEGYNVTRQRADPVPDLGAHPVADPRPARHRPANMKRYAEHAGLRRPPGRALPARRGGRPPRRRDAGLRLDQQGRPRSAGTRGRRASASRATGSTSLGIAFVPTGTGGGEPLGRPAPPPLPLRRRDRAGRHRPQAGRRRPGSGLIPKEIFTRFEDTGGREEEIRRHPAATVGLSRIKEVVITHEQAGEARRDRPHGDATSDSSPIPYYPTSDRPAVREVPSRTASASATWLAGPELRREGVADDPLAVDHEGGAARDQAERLRDAVARRTDPSGSLRRRNGRPWRPAKRGATRPSRS